MNYVKGIGYSLLGVTVLVSGWYGYQYYNLVKGGIIVKGVKAKKVGGHIQVTLTIYNPTSADVTINGGQLDVFLLGHNILDGKIMEVTHVKGRSESDIIINIVPDWFGLALTIGLEGYQIVEDLKDWNIAALDIRAKGAVYITKGNVRIPFETKLIKDA